MVTAHLGSLPSERAVWLALAGVNDPEIPMVNIVEMGMVRGVQLDENGVTVQFTPTFSGCPALYVIRQDIRRAVEHLGVSRVEVQTVISPPWSTDDITASARQKLEHYGIAPPSGRANVLLKLHSDPVTCPRCHSFDTRITSSFGSALCKRLYVCNCCHEPFEGMKTI